MSIFRLGGAAALSLLAVAPAAGQGTKVGYINSDAILAEYGPAQEAQKSMEATLAGYRTELERLGQDIQQAWTQYQQQQMTMNADARRAREEDLQGMEAKLQERTQQLEGQAAQRQAEVFQPIMEEIRTVLEEIRVQGGYGMILDTASKAILVADPDLELTQQLLTRLRDRSGTPGEGR